MVTVSAKQTRRSTRPNGEGEKKKQYQVEAILDKRKRGRKVEYLLKWKGYSDADNSWEDESHLNCPDLVREFERKQMLKTKKSNKKTSPRKLKASTTDETDDDSQTDEDKQSQTTESTMTETIDDEDLIVVRHSQRKKLLRSTLNENRSSRTNQRKSSRNIIHQTKSRITSMSREETSDDDDEDEHFIRESPTKRKSTRRTTISPKVTKTSNETPIILIDDENFDGRISQRHTNQENGNTSTTNASEQRPYISVSSITFGPNVTNQTNGSTKNKHDEQEIPNESHLVEHIESVRNDPDGLTFHIKLIGEDEPQWISSKIANLRYPQAVIAFWESHVEFA